MKQQAVKGLLKTLKDINSEKTRRVADLEDGAKAIHKQLQEWGHRITGTNASTARKATPARAASKIQKRRQRRNPEQLKADATKALKIIREAKGEGIGGGKVRSQVPGVGQDIKGFIAQHAGVKVKTTGQKSKMLYFPPT
jgi:hypothetical protein